MEPCNADRWDMTILFGPGIPVGRPFFRNVKVTGGVIKGDVTDEENNPISDLGGTCVPIVGLNIPEVSQMTFLFRMKDAGSEIGIFLIGYAFTPAAPPGPEPPKPSFFGTWLAHPPGADTPQATGDAPAGFILPGSGDTGSGTGTGT